jgi:lactate permease
MTWTQVYTPLWNNLPVSALAAALPVIVLLGLLAFFHARAHLAALAGLAAAILVAVLIYRMPAKLALLSAVNGALYGLFPIGWIVLCAIFAYDITVHTGQFEILKRSIAHLADDPRIQALLIAFSFGAFIEGAAGFGTPVAISAAMLIGLGFKPLQAAGLALIGNTAPVAYGALGTPIIALAKVTQLPLEQLSAMAGRQLPLFSIIVPFWLVWAMAGLRGMLQVWPACLTAGLSFGIVQFLVSNYHGPWVVDIAGAGVSIASLVLLLRFWKPRVRWRFADEPAGSGAGPDSAAPARPAPVLDCTAEHRGKGVFRAYLPWLILSVFVFAWGLPQMKDALNTVHNPAFEIAGLHNSILRAPPVVKAPKPEEARFSLNYLSATGTALLLSAIVSGLLLGLKPLTLLKLFTRTLHRVRWSLLTIAAMLALGFTTRFGGLDATMGLAFASTGVLFPFFSPLLGWLGVALTGSDTSSNVLFGNLQQITAERLNISPILAAASNSSGGVMGKMIDAQSIVVASVATNQHGGEGHILRYVFFHSLALAMLVGMLVFAQAYWFKWMIPR